MKKGALDCKLVRLCTHSVPTHSLTMFEPTVCVCGFLEVETPNSKQTCETKFCPPCSYSQQTQALLKHSPLWWPMNTQASISPFFALCISVLSINFGIICATLTAVQPSVTVMVQAAQINIHHRPPNSLLNSSSPQSLMSLRKCVLSVCPHTHNHRKWTLTTLANKRTNARNTKDWIHFCCFCWCGWNIFEEKIYLGPKKVSLMQSSAAAAAFRQSVISASAATVLTAGTFSNWNRSRGSSSTRCHTVRTREPNGEAN